MALGSTGLWWPAVLSVLVVGAAGVLSCALVDNHIIGTGSIAAFPGTASATECCSRCQNEPRCKSFTWVKSGVGARSPLDCFLKGNVADSGADNRTMSGYCGAAPPPPSPPGPLDCQPPPLEPYPAVLTLPRCSGLPDPFRLPGAGGGRVTDGAGWLAHRQTMIALIQHYMMGHAPARPPVRSQLNGTAAGTHVTTLCDSVAPGACDNPTPCQPVDATRWNFTLRVGPNASATVPFDVYVYVPRNHASGKLAFFVYNGEGFDSCEGHGDLTAQGIRVLLNRGYGVASFNRNQLRVDTKTPVDPLNPSGLQLPDGVQKLYPDQDWGTISVWAWGAAAVTDFLLDDPVISPLVDPTRLMSMGHSRGGKTALWHAAQDSRVSAVFPLMSGMGGNGPLRVSTPRPNRPIVPGECDLPTARRPGDNCSETVADITSNFPYWFHPRFAKFGAGEEERAPWDQHWQRMLVAPRAQLGVEGLRNEHENPMGSQASFTAAQTVYNWLGVPGKIGIAFHPGAHPMNDRPNETDWTTVADFADLVQFGRSPANASEFNTTAYTLPNAWRWQPPSTPP